MHVNVIWKSYDPNSPPRGYWCYGWLEEIFSNSERESPFYWGVNIDDVPAGEGAVVVVCVPPEYPTDYVAQLNSELAALTWVVLIIASDEQGRFPVEQLAPHPQMSLWVMTPHFEKHEYPVGTQFMGEMYPPQTRLNLIKTVQDERTLRWSFSGQITHERRRQMVDALEGLHGGYLNKTAGFTQGLEPIEYADVLNRSITVPCPSGPVTPDSFRAFEALEAGCVPILDGECPTTQDCERYWQEIFGYLHPLPVVHDWTHAVPIIESNSDCYPSENIRIYSWWQMYKRELRYRILDGIPGYDFGKYTILMPTSVIPSHPSMEKIEAVLKSVRFHHPHADIIIMCDGIRPEQEHRREDYEAYLDMLLYCCNFEWSNVYPLVFDSFQHQANMTRWALDLVRTPLILFVEHDIQMVTDMPIDWPSVTRIVESGDIDVLKFSFEAMGIHPEHEHMALDPEIVVMYGCPVRRTVQWSQRPHVATTAYYRRMINDHFPLSCRTMIEDRMHSVAQEFPERHRLASYIPLEGSAVRCFHIDGREGDEKYGMKYE